MVGLGFCGVAQEVGRGRTLSRELLMAAEVPLSPKLASRRNVAGPSEPGRGSRGDEGGTAGVVAQVGGGGRGRGAQQARIDPLPMFAAAPWGEIACPLPENMLLFRSSLLGVTRRRPSRSG